MQVALNHKPDIIIPRKLTFYIVKQRSTRTSDLRGNGSEKMVGEGIPRQPIEMLVGSYVHAWNEGRGAVRLKSTPINVQ